MARKVSHRELPAFGIHTVTRGVMPWEVDRFHGHGYVIDPRGMSRAAFHDALMRLLRENTKTDAKLVVYLASPRSLRERANPDAPFSEAPLRIPRETLRWRHGKAPEGTEARFLHMNDVHLGILDPKGKGESDQRLLEAAWRGGHGDKPMKGPEAYGFVPTQIAKWRKAKLMRMLNRHVSAGD